MDSYQASGRLLDDFTYRLLTSHRESPVDVQHLLSRLEVIESKKTGPGLDADEYVKTAKALTSAGFPLLGERVARKGLSAHPAATGLECCMAQALARLGSSQLAGQIVDSITPRLASSDPFFVESHALRGRLFTDAALRTEDVQARRALFQQAAQAYEVAAGVTRHGEQRADATHFPVINAASMRLLAGHHTAARAHAAVARSLAQAEFESGKHNYWTLASLGEAALILGEQTAAHDYYLEAASRAQGRRGDVATMHRRLRVLSSVCDVPAGLLQDMSIGPVLLYTGHRADSQMAPAGRFTSAHERQVAADVRAYLREMHPKPSAVIGSAASGVDIIVLEEAAKLGIERHVWLPFGEQEFVERSVRDGGETWIERFHKVMDDATRTVTVPTESTSAEAVPFLYLQEIVLGAGLLDADRLGTELRGLAVLNPASLGRPGGTADTARRWMAAKLPVRTIALQTSDEAPTSAPASTEDRCLRAMLFSDMVGYSAMAEPNIRKFPRHFLGLVRELLDHRPEDIDFRNTWGDGLFLGFKCWEAAARFALNLRERVIATDWQSLGLPAHTTVRMGMHGGPIFKEWDPVLERDNYFGAHVVRAARIEPITAPGSIWLTEEMACLIASRKTRDLGCQYLGEMPLAKGYDHRPLYALERGNHWMNQ